MQVEGRTALVTGASRGLGRAVALALAARGAAVVLAARTARPGGRLPGSLAETAAAVEALGGTALPVACDLSHAEQVEDLAAAAIARHGHVDVLVNNAAYLGRAAFHGLDELTATDWRRQVDVNLTAPWLLTRSLVPGMRAADGGVVVNVTSAAGALDEDRTPGFAYGVTKAGLNRLTTALARELATDGITVFAVDPGYVRTEVAEQAAEHPGWEIDIDEALPPSVAASVIADLVEQDAAEVGGRIWTVEPGGTVVAQV